MGKTHFARVLVALAAVWVLIVLLACKSASVGSSCSEGNMKCTSSTAALFCNKGKFAAMNCSGPKGCNDTARGIDCDNTVAAVGDACDTEQEYACTADKKSGLECKGNVFAVRSSCGGEKGCYWVGSNVHCDTDSASAGDVCDIDDDVACSPDKKAALKCTGGKYTAFMSCEGDEGCSVTGSKVQCDHTLADVGDPCSGDDIACDHERDNLLVCKGNRYVVKDGCDPPGCSFKKSSGKVDYTCP